MRRAGAAVVLALVAAACTGGDPEVAADRPTPSSTPTASPSASASPSPSRSATPRPVTPTPNALTPVVASLQRFVEQAHGLRFKRPVQTELLAPAAFAARVRTTFATDPADVAADRATLVALRLLDPGVDLKQEYDELFTGLVGGFYDPAADRLVIGGASVTPRTRVILAHELTHALADQHVDLDRPELDERDDEAALGLSVLAEGDAERVEAAYRATLTAAERDSVRREAATRGADVPAVLRRLLAIPYDFGPGLVGAVREAYGLDGVLDAYRRPPTTSEQFLHPRQAYLRRQEALPVAEPRADGSVVDRGVLGEIGLRLTLAPVLGASTATRAASGWGGDRYVTWTAGGRSCLRLAVVMDTEQDLTELRRAFETWGGVTLAGQRPLTVTTCR